MTDPTPIGTVTLPTVYGDATIAVSAEPLSVCLRGTLGYASRGLKIDPGTALQLAMVLATAAKVAGAHARAEADLEPLRGDPPKL